MTNRTNQFAAFLLLSALSLACSGATELREASPTARRVSSADPPTFEITSAPTPNQALEAGVFEIRGRLVAPGGLAQDEALVLGVTDAVTGLWSVTDIGLFVSDNSEYLQETSFDQSTGEFAIVGGHDMVLDRGSKVLTLTGTDALGQICGWSETVESGPYWVPSSAEIGQARAQFMSQMLKSLRIYKAVVRSKLFASPYDHVDVDLQFMELLDAYQAARIGDPTCVSGSPIGNAFEDNVKALIQGLPSTTNIEESNYRIGMVNAASRERERSAGDQKMAVEQQLHLLPPPMPDYFMRVEDLADFQHTFIDAQVTPGSQRATGSAGLVSIRIYQDRGAPPGLWSATMAGAWDPQSLEAGTANWERPGLQLDIEFFDRNHDGLIEEVVNSGYQYNPETSAQELFEDTQDHGHLITPLRYLFASMYYDTGGA